MIDDDKLWEYFYPGITSEFKETAPRKYTIITHEVQCRNCKRYTNFINGTYNHDSKCFHCGVYI